MCFSKFSGRTAVLVLVAVLMAACGGGSGEVEPAPTSSGLGNVPLVSTAKNVLAVKVDAGPTDTGYNVNRLYASVTICEPGSTTRCQTIDHVLVDTGSTGLRLLSSVLNPQLDLSRLTGSSGWSLFNCAKFIDNTFAWGTVAAADVWLGGMTASTVPMQIIADATSALPAAPSCADGAAEINSAKTLGANGIIGLGLFREDCGALCAQVVDNGVYFTCSDASCTASIATKVRIDQQLKNPVPLFASDRNGVVVDLPPVDPAGAASLDGTLVFGIGTQSNNQLASATVLSANAVGYVTTLFEGRTLDASFFDTGSNGLYFDSGSILACGDAAPGFYCPSAPTAFAVQARGVNAATVAVSFVVDNAVKVFGDGSKAVLPTLAGDIGNPQMFDWGLPFFYGRRVFIGIEGLTPSLSSGSFYAF